MSGRSSSQIRQKWVATHAFNFTVKQNKEMVLERDIYLTYHSLLGGPHVHKRAWFTRDETSGSKTSIGVTDGLLRVPEGLSLWMLRASGCPIDVREDAGNASVDQRHCNLLLPRATHIGPSRKQAEVSMKTGDTERRDKQGG